MSQYLKSVHPYPVFLLTLTIVTVILKIASNKILLKLLLKFNFFFLVTSQAHQASTHVPE